MGNKQKTTAGQPPQNKREEVLETVRSMAARQTYPQTADLCMTLWQNGLHEESERLTQATARSILGTLDAMISEGGA